jgi:transposase
MTYTPKSKLAEMAAAGASIAEMAKAFHRSEDTIQRMLRRIGMARPVGRAPAFPLDLEKEIVLKVKRHVLSVEEAAVLYNVSPRTIQRLVRRHRRAAQANPRGSNADDCF